MEFDQLLAYLFRWIHMFAGVAWIGLLYYFNFVQTEYFKEAEAPAKASAIDKLVPRALWWFRYGARLLFSRVGSGRISGRCCEFLHNSWHSAGHFNVLERLADNLAKPEVVIASNAQVLAGSEAMPDAAAAQAKAGLASRTNTLFSMPMLFFMGASGHLGGLWPGSSRPRAASAERQWRFV